MRPSLTIARIIYIGVWCIIALITLLFEQNALTWAFIPATPETQYALHLLCIILTLTGTWGSLRLFKFLNTRHANLPYSIGEWNIVRTSIMAVCILINLITYYGLMSGTTPLYCLLITLAGFVFCWPKTNELNNESLES